MESRGTSSESNKPGSGSGPFQKLISNFGNAIKKKLSSRSRSPDVSPRAPLNVTAPGRHCPETHPRKRAVLCGVTYRNRKFRLKGTVNDVKSMRELLIKHFDYSQECIRVLTGNYYLF
jgi:hypothetical protein